MERIDSIDHGQILKISKPNGNLIYEFRRSDDPIMTNMIDVWRYDSKKKSKGKSSWLTTKDFYTYINILSNEGFTFITWETK
jgi:hypothetical protein